MKRTTQTLALALAAALAFHANAFATAQEPDLLIHNGEKYDLTVNPMEPFFKENPEKRPPSPSTALWRGYIATFEIIKNELWVVDIKTEKYDKVKKESAWESITKNCLDGKSKMKVDWFTGLLVLPQGKTVEYVHMGYGSTYERYKLIEIEKGKYIKEYELNYEQYSKKYHMKKPDFMPDVSSETYDGARDAKIDVKTLTDKRDGKKYKTVKIGGQTWMAENLSYEAEGSKCYNDSTAYCEKYGRLYDWNVAMKSCPAGWHLPVNAEWDALYRFADSTSGPGGPYGNAGLYLKAKSGWNDYKTSGNGIDAYSFAALPGGFGASDGTFFRIGNYGTWWSATENDAKYAYRQTMFHHLTKASWESGGKAVLFSVRCVEDGYQKAKRR